MDQHSRMTWVKVKGTVNSLFHFRATTGGWSMQSTVRYVGLDVHKETIVMAVAESNTSPAEVLTEVAYDVGIVLKQLRKLGPLSSLQVCYEAGPTGFSLQRHLAAAGVACLV